MIDGVGKSGSGRIDGARAADTGRVAAPGKLASRTEKSAVESAVFALVSSGPPVDVEKVAALRSAIADGRYAIDPQRIAERMIALDLPAKGA